MSESEKYETQGRTHADLKKAISNAATASAALHAHVIALSETARSLSTFIDSPGANSHLAHSLKESVQRVSDHKRISNLIDDLASETKIAEELQRRVDQF